MSASATNLAEFIHIPVMLQKNQTVAQSAQIQKRAFSVILVNELETGITEIK